jgi:hypothetical protein
MKYLPLDSYFFENVDDYFSSKFKLAQSVHIEPSDMFTRWTHSITSADLELRFEDLKRTLQVDHYIPCKYRRSVIPFLNYLFKLTPCLSQHYLTPVQTVGIFRQYRWAER